MTDTDTAQTMLDTETVPKLGLMVLYELSDSDAFSINAGHSTPGRRNLVSPGDLFPAMIVRIWKGSPVLVQLQVFFDGAGTFWATSRRAGAVPGSWRPLNDG